MSRGKFQKLSGPGHGRNGFAPGSRNSAGNQHPPPRLTEYQKNTLAVGGKNGRISAEPLLCPIVPVLTFSNSIPNLVAVKPVKLRLGVASYDTPTWVIVLLPEGDWQ
jgi:hypothetical protein